MLSRGFPLYSVLLQVVLQTRLCSQSCSCTCNTYTRTSYSVKKQKQQGNLVVWRTARDCPGCTAPSFPGFILAAEIGTLRYAASAATLGWVRREPGLIPAAERGE